MKGEPRAPVFLQFVLVYGGHQAAEVADARFVRVSAPLEDDWRLRSALRVRALPRK
jgi:hypothetical protein